MAKAKYQGRVGTVRLLVQWGFLVWVIFIGIRFGMFVRHFESGGAFPFVARPPGVEGFLPIGALTSFKYWLVSGEFDPLHPAALVIFLTVILMSLVAKKSFCSWLCPVGTLSEGAWKLGKRFFGRNFQIWNWLDIVLRGLKYVLLLFFVKIILIDMTATALAEFLTAPYWAASDIKMLRFFTHMSMNTVVILGILTGLSLIYKNFWCRYLCPYGALLGLISFISPLKVRRNTVQCTGCQRCSAACPSRLPVHTSKAISSPECTGCLTCVENCPEQNVLQMSPPFRKQAMPAWFFPCLVIITFAVGIGAGMISGHWNSVLTYADYQRLIAIAPQLSH